MFPYEVATVLGAIATVVLTILLYIKVMPRKYDGKFDKKIHQRLHDFFHFKRLYLEDVLKFIYVLATVATVCVGVFYLVSYVEEYHSYYYISGGYTSKEPTFLIGLALIFGGPIALRLVYEGIMMFILLVKNVIDINNKLSGKEADEAPVAPATPVAPVAPVMPTMPVAPVEDANPEAANKLD